MVIVENHHEVLVHWATYRQSLVKAPRLITLDHHTDTSAPFRTQLKKYAESEAEQLRIQWLNKIDFNDLNTVLLAQDKLDHDEHILTAIQADIISGAFVIAQNAYDTSLETYHKHKVMCLSVDRKVPMNGITIDELDRVLETDFLKSLINTFDSQLANMHEKPLLQEPFILDIDLDYLNTKKSVLPLDSTFLGKLINAAGLITIAVESEHVLLCAKERDLTSSYLLQELKKIIEAYK